MARHTAIMMVARYGIDVEVIQQLAGHSSSYLTNKFDDDVTKQRTVNLKDNIIDRLSG